MIGGHFAVSNVLIIGSTWHAHSYMTPIKPLLRDLIRFVGKIKLGNNRSIPKVIMAIKVAYIPTLTALIQLGT